MSKRTAVVIDDEVDLTNFLTSILEENDFEVRAANDAASGELLIREQPPSIVLIDLRHIVLCRLFWQDRIRHVNQLRVNAIQQMSEIFGYVLSCVVLGFIVFCRFLHDCLSFG